MCVRVPGEYGERRPGHQRIAVLHPGYQSTVAGRETCGFWQSPGRDGGGPSDTFHKSAACDCLKRIYQSEFVVTCGLVIAG